MNLQHLKNITEVERAGSVTKAAANLFMGQPNLSKSIKEVENEIGITVFRRSAKGVYPTPEGARFLSRARAVLEEMDKLEALYKQENTVRSLSVSVPDGEYAALAIAAFVRLLPQGDRVNIECITASLSRAAANVCEEICSIAAVRCPHSEEDYFRTLMREMKLRSELLFTGEYKLIIPEKSRLSEMNKITPETLGGYIELTSSNEPQGISSGAGKIMLSGSDPLSMLSQLPEGYMIAPELSHDTLKKYGLIMREYEPAGKYSEYLIYNSGYKPDEYAAAFISCLKNAINERRI
ncbi:MAG: LysR family transcriptional regulator [Oscillospiraceae bacterium]|nr:LysR family transcriptional regulator [Oscillospiraceae bacterium]